MVDIVQLHTSPVTGLRVFNGALAADHLHPVRAIARLDQLAFAPGAIVSVVAGKLLAVRFLAAPELLATEPETALGTTTIVAAAETLKLDRSLAEILQILSVTIFEKTPILEALDAEKSPFAESDLPKQAQLFDL